MTATVSPPVAAGDDGQRGGVPAPASEVPVAPGPVAAPEPVVEVRRNLRPVQERDLLPVVGSALAAVAMGWIIYYVVTPWSGILGFVVVTYALFLGLYALLVSLDGDLPLVKDRIAAVAAHSFAALLLAALVVVVVYTFVEGRIAFKYVNFFLEDMSRAGPLDPLTVGGVLHAAIGTLIMITMALSLTIPLGVISAVFLSETRGPFPRFVRTIVEAMTALPSIVAGLFIYAMLITLQQLSDQPGFGWAAFLGKKSATAAALAISIMMLPILIRAADVVLRLVPGTLKEAAAALGAPRWRIVWNVVLPTARSGIMTAIILATARGIGETSPVLLTAGAGANSSFNLNPFSGPMTSLPLTAFQLTRSPEPAYVARGFGAALLLLMVVLVLFVIARIIGGRAPGDLSAGQLRRRARASAQDVARMSARHHGSPVTTPVPEDPR